MLSNEPGEGWRHALGLYARFCIGDAEESEWRLALSSLPDSVLLIPEAERSEAQGAVVAMLYDAEALELLMGWSSPVYDPTVHVWLAYVFFDAGGWADAVHEVELSEKHVDMNDANHAKLWEIYIVSKLHMDPQQVHPEDFVELVRRYSANELGALEPVQLKAARGILDSGGCRREVRDAGLEAIRILELLYERDSCDAEQV